LISFYLRDKEIDGNINISRADFQKLVKPIMGNKIEIRNPSYIDLLNEE